MFRITRSAAAAFALSVVAAGLVTANVHVSRGALPRSEALTRVASAQMLVFVPADAHSQPVGYIDGRPVPSSLATPIIVRWRGGDTSNIAVAQTTRVIP